jgi:hypothetical protein
MNLEFEGGQVLSRELWLLKTDEVGYGKLIATNK